MEISLLFIGLRQMYQVEISELNRNSKVSYYEALTYWKEIKNTILLDLIHHVGKIRVYPEELDRYNLDGTIHKFKQLLASRAEEILYKHAVDLQLHIENNILGKFDNLYKLATTFDRLLLAAADFKSKTGKKYKKRSKLLKDLLMAENAKLMNPTSKSSGDQTETSHKMILYGRLEGALGLLSLCSELRRMEVSLENINGLSSFQTEIKYAVQRTLDAAFDNNHENLEEALNSHMALVYEKITVAITNFVDQIQSEIQ